MKSLKLGLNKPLLLFTSTFFFGFINSLQILKFQNVLCSMRLFLFVQIKIQFKELFLFFFDKLLLRKLLNFKGKPIICRFCCQVFNQFLNFTMALKLNLQEFNEFVNLLISHTRNQFQKAMPCFFLSPQLINLKFDLLDRIYQQPFLMTVKPHDGSYLHRLLHSSFLLFLFPLFHFMQPTFILTSQQIYLQKHEDLQQVSSFLFKEHS